MGLCLLPKKIRKPAPGNPQAFCFEGDDCYTFKQTSPLDLSLAIQGIVLYGAYFVVISYKKPFPLREMLFLAVAVSVRSSETFQQPATDRQPAQHEKALNAACSLKRLCGRFRQGACFSCYLLYVIKVILKEFCIVCFSFHCCNFAMLVLAVLEFRNPSVKAKVAVD